MFEELSRTLHIIGLGCSINMYDFHNFYQFSLEIVHNHALQAAEGDRVCFWREFLFFRISSKKMDIASQSQSPRQRTIFFEQFAKRPFSMTTLQWVLWADGLIDIRPRR